LAGIYVLPVRGRAVSKRLFFPNFTRSDFANGNLVNPKLIGDGLLSAATISNVKRLIPCNLVAFFVKMMPFACREITGFVSRMAAAINNIFAIPLLITEVKVIRVYTPWVVAFMKNPQPIGDRPIVDNPTNFVRKHLFSGPTISNLKLAVSELCNTSSPLPTAGCDIKLFEKPSETRCRKHLFSPCQ
jgi:hypothetical protein